MNSSCSLSNITSRFSTNSTIEELLRELFVEEWQTRIDYSSYFHRCSPLICSYTYVEKLNIFHTVTLLFGLQGGLAIILKWICPKIIELFYKIYQYRQKRISVATHANSNSTVPVSNHVPAQYVIPNLI